MFNRAKYKSTFFTCKQKYNINFEKLDAVRFTVIKLLGLHKLNNLFFLNFSGIIQSHNFLIALNVYQV